jgi:hypothetical protein
LKVNLSADQASAVIAGERQTSGLRQARVWTVLIALVLFPLLKYGLAVRVAFLPLTAVILVVTYFLAIYLYRTITEVVLQRSIWPVAAASAVAMACGAIVCPSGEIVMMLAETLTITAASVVTGRSLHRGNSGLKPYVIGALVVLIGGAVMFAPQWKALMELLKALGQENAAALSQSLGMVGYHPEAARSYADQFNAMVDAVARLVPAATLMSVVTQFTVGYLWFLLRGLPQERSAVLLPPFARWKAPFALTPILIAAALGRLLGGETVVLAADNVLFMLSIYYCVGGLALIEYSLQRLRLRMILRILFYIALTFTGLFGYLLAVLLGFADSFADWRKVSRTSIQLDKN